MIGKMIIILFTNSISENEKSIDYKCKNIIRDEVYNVFKIVIKRKSIQSDLPMDYLFNIHFNLIHTTHKWISENWDTFSENSVESIEVRNFVNKVIEMFKSALEPLDMNK